MKVNREFLYIFVGYPNVCSYHNQQEYAQVMQFGAYRKVHFITSAQLNN